MLKYNYIKAILFFLTALSSILLFWFIVGQFIVFNMSSSEKIGLYLINKQEVEKNALYIIKIPTHYMKIITQLGYNADGTLLKRIVGEPNDTVLVTESGIIVNNILQNNSQIVNNVRGVWLDPQPIGKKVTLKNGEYWVTGETKNSYDSRYFGIVYESQIIRRARPIFTW